MRCPAIDQLVYEHMFPRPKACDPSNFSGFLTRFLVFEVRQEVHSFFGHLDTQEAKYPGLDYSHPIHRIRLSRWPWHRRLFRAFDALRLTPTEIASLTKWEGTLWAKERYEKEQNIFIEDTTAEGMPDYRRGLSLEAEGPPNFGEYVLVYPDPHLPVVEVSRQGTTDELLVAHTPATSHTQTTPLRERSLNEARDNFGSRHLVEGDEGDILSIGMRLNERLRERVAAHNAGDTSQPLDEDWEQWLKNALETGNLNMVAQHMPLDDLPFVHSQYTSQARAGTSSRLDAALQSSDQATSMSVGQTLGLIQAENEPPYFNIVPSQILHSARLGRWDEVPNFLHEVLRQTINDNTYQEAAASPREVRYPAISASTATAFAQVPSATSLNHD
ncbi:hypothetical protein SEPCBS57363_005691 [Sporothrix epigloea]|uniref:Uncharacterized protein n=1 Tax=Sporothrix epigloea TaxID=1892477 RepID=A0ABP0DYX9_9PEZI